MHKIHNRNTADDSIDLLTKCKTAWVVCLRIWWIWNISTELYKNRRSSFSPYRLFFRLSCRTRMKVQWTVVIHSTFILIWIACRWIEFNGSPHIIPFVFISNHCIGECTTTTTTVSSTVNRPIFSLHLFFFAFFFCLKNSGSTIQIEFFTYTHTRTHLASPMFFFFFAFVCRMFWQIDFFAPVKNSMKKILPQINSKKSYNERIERGWPAMLMVRRNNRTDIDTK